MKNQNPTGKSSPPKPAKVAKDVKAKTKLRQIKLSEIPVDGESFELSLTSTELWDGLTDLLGPDKTQTHLEGLVHIVPIGSGRYTLKGQIQCYYPERCSRCGLDFKQPLRFKCDEILLPAQATMPRNSSYKKTNFVSQSLDMERQLEAIEVSGGSFDLIEFLHEQIGLNQPLYPVPSTQQDRCTVCMKDITEGSFDYRDPQLEKLSPFEVLKSLKTESM